jgi:hypothetical protein
MNGNVIRNVGFGNLLDLFVDKLKFERDIEMALEPQREVTCTVAWRARKMR